MPNKVMTADLKIYKSSVVSVTLLGKKDYKYNSLNDTMPDNQRQKLASATIPSILVILAIAAIVIAVFVFLNHRATTINNTCPGFYWYNTTAKQCQPQTISPACPPNHPNQPVYYACSGTKVPPGICPSDYTFNSAKSQCIINSGSSTTSTTPTTSAATTTTPPTTTINASRKFSQRFCLNGEQNATVMQYAVSNGVTCFRADIYNSEGEIRFIANSTMQGAQYLGILDYATVGAQPSLYGCLSGCNWTLNTWNSSVSNALANYPEVHTWEIYNEPLGSNFASGYEDKNASHYFNMIKSAYNIIKSKDPNATIVCFGGATMHPSVAMQEEFSFYQQVWGYGASKYCDAISLHAYNQPYYNFSQVVYNGLTLTQWYNSTLYLYENLTEKPIWITETGIPSNNWTAGINLSEQKQAAYLTQDMSFFASYPFVKRVYWFHLIGYANRYQDYGLLNMTTLQPKPAWHSFLYFVNNSSD